MADKKEDTKPDAIVAPVEVKTEAQIEDEAGEAEGHVKMFLDDVRLWVHAECVKAHQAAGWLIHRV